MGKKIVLLYHRVNRTENDYNRITIEEKNFYAHMSYLKENYKVLTLEEMLSYSGEEDAIAITFDDGFADFYWKALPILTQFQIPAAVFITTGKLNTLEELWTTEILRILFANNAGEEEIQIEICGRQVTLSIFSVEQRAETYRILRNVLMQMSEGERSMLLDGIRKQLGMGEKGREEYRLMSIPEIQELAENPLVTIGAHTVNHISLGKTDGTELVYEIQESVKGLERISGRRIKYFAYPFGGMYDYSEKAIEVLRENRMEAAFTVEGRSYEADKDSVYKIPRLCVGNWTLEQFERRLKQWIMGKDEKNSIKSTDGGMYVGKIEKDAGLWEAKRKMIIWGTGIRGRRIYHLLCQWKQADRVIAFGDNNPKMWNQTIDDIPVWNIEKIAKQRDIDIILDNMHDVELLKQFAKMGLENIHWLV